MNLGQLFQTVLAIVKADEMKAVLPALATFFNSISTNPTAINVTAAFTKLQVDVLAAQPAIGQDALAQIAAAVNAAAQALLNPPAPAAAK